MNHKGTVLLETDRLILRKMRLDDSLLAFRNWTSDEKVTKFLPWKTHESVEDTRDIINLWVKNYERDDFYHWVIILKEINEPVGTISVVSKDENLEMVEVGYCIGSKWWRKGITSEAFSSVIKFLFEEVGVNRIEAKHDPLNENSGKVMIKCGLIFEGVLRDRNFSNNSISDASMYGILKREYFKK